MKERPIIFSAPMVRAILSGTKTQTRRLWKLPRGCNWYAEMGGEREGWFVDHGAPWWLHATECRCPYGVPGDRLWVRETWQAFFEDEIPKDRARGPRHTMGIPAQPERKSFVYYRADGDGPVHPIYGWKANWKSPLHLPRKYSRILLEVTGVRVERLQEITEADAIAEGMNRFPGCCQDDDAAAFSRVGLVIDDSFPIARYAALWEQIHGPGSWGANPWVWVVEFKRMQEPSK